MNDVKNIFTVTLVRTMKYHNSIVYVSFVQARSKRIFVMMCIGHTCIC